MKKLIEVLDLDSRIEESGDGSLRMKVPFLQADSMTANNRTYPLGVLKNAIAELKAKLAKCLGFGSTSHKEHLEVDDTSHLIEDVELQGKTVVATVKILPTTKGQNLLAILRHGGKVGVSSRGRGEVQTVEGREIVKEGYSLEGLDFVLSPASGMYAGMEMVCESAPLDAEEKLDEEQALKNKYYDAVRTSGFRGDFETFKMSQDRETMDRVTKLRERYASALKAGYKGTETEYFDAMEKR